MTDRSTAPVVIGGGDRLEMDGDHLRGSDQLRRILFISGAELVAHICRWLGQLHADARKFRGEFKSLLRRCRLEGWKPLLLLW